MSIEVPCELPHTLPSLTLVRVPSEENTLRPAKQPASPSLRPGSCRSGHGPSPSPMALRRLSPNHSMTPLSLVREGSWDSTRFQRFAKKTKPASLNLDALEMPEQAQSDVRKVRPALSLEIPVTSSSDVCTLRRTSSWTEGSLADTVDGATAVLTEEETMRAEAFVRSLSGSIRVLAIDFDLTMVSMHTGGRWWGSVEVLARNVRPLFKTIVPLALEAGIEVCIVTNSAQTTLISKVLKRAMPCDTSKIRIRGGEKSVLVTETGDMDTANVQGSRKNRHIASVLSAREGAAVVPHEVLLIDDDELNVAEALEHGLRAVVFSPDNPCFLICGVDPASSFDSSFDVAMDEEVASDDL